MCSGIITVYLPCDFFFKIYVFQRVKNDGAKKNCAYHYFGIKIYPKFAVLSLYARNTTI